METRTQKLYGDADGPFKRRYHDDVKTNKAVASLEEKHAVNFYIK